MKEWKEFCSGCGKHYTMKNGEWKPCPSCDGAGKKNSGEAVKGKEATYQKVRDRWDLNPR